MIQEWLRTGHPSSAVEKHSPYHQDTLNLNPNNTTTMHLPGVREQNWSCLLSGRDGTTFSKATLGSSKGVVAGFTCPDDICAWLHPTRYVAGVWARRAG